MLSFEGLGGHKYWFLKIIYKKFFSSIFPPPRKNTISYSLKENNSICQDICFSLYILSFKRNPPQQLIYFLEQLYFSFVELLHGVKVKTCKTISKSLGNIEWVITCMNRAIYFFCKRVISYNKIIYLNRWDI